ncbi:hypothetical protein M9H77_03523 [Catharanthus roseus]|uniref:Uncharacterized protein n=1 Tax=Catharanthus roseus TaxID=4058 RepID=A0ACC0CBJ3_CATRO|nr:hypothetical protein M9H77_03523 [Catharanthus roseus]
MGCFKRHGKDVRLTAKDVHRILGLPIGGTDIEDKSSKPLDNRHGVSSEVPILYETKKLGQLNWSKYVDDFLENGIKLRNTGDRASVSGCMLLLAVRNSSNRDTGGFSRKQAKKWEPFVDDRLNGPVAAKLVTLMTVPSRFAENIDCPIVAENVEMHDADEDTISD